MALKDTLPAVLKSYVLKKKNDVVVFVRNLMDKKCKSIIDGI